MSQGDLNRVEKVKGREVNRIKFRRKRLMKNVHKYEGEEYIMLFYLCGEMMKETLILIGPICIVSTYSLVTSSDNIKSSS